MTASERIREAREICEHANAIGDILVRRFPPVVADGMTDACAIPVEAVWAVSEEISLVVANILQAWLDAGSERENTMEELIGPIEDHIRSWSA